MKQSEYARLVNEWLTSKGPFREDALDLRCECGRVRCEAYFVLTRDEFAHVRRGRGELLVVREHLDSDAEIVHDWRSVLVVRFPG